MYPILRNRYEEQKKGEGKIGKYTDKDILWDWALCLHLLDGLRHGRGTGPDDARISAVGNTMLNGQAACMIVRGRSLFGRLRFSI